MKLGAVIAALALIIAASLLTYAVFVWQDRQLGNMSELEQQVAVLENRLRQEAADITDDDVAREEDGGDEENGDEPVILTGQIKLAKIQVDWEEDLIKVADCNEGSECYLVGRIKNSDPVYNGKPFYLELTYGMGYDINHYILEKGEDGVEKRLYARDYENDTEVPIAGISDIPETIVMPENGKELKKHFSPSEMFSEKDAEILFTHKTLGNVYLLSGGCVAAKLPDYTVIGYDFSMPFVSGESKVADITFDDSSKNTEEYTHTQPQCGGICTKLAIEGEGVKMEELTKAGMAPDGSAIYKLKDREDKRLRDLYLDKNTKPYFDENYEHQEESRYTYDQFIASNPYLFWQDPLGRWIRLANDKFSGLAEMCKPVIYLYPEKETDVEIKVDVNGGITYAEPAYAGDWKVTAYPDGTIKDIRTGKSYESLLWEGIGLDYPKQEAGWVVAKADLGAFFDKKLMILGLNRKERNDFKDYWLARMDEKPFYKISFLARAEFDALAQVSFSPLGPDKFIRVMMTAKGLDKYEEIPAQKLPASPARTGFTAVEWGGALLR